MDESSLRDSRFEEFKAELLDRVTDPLHKRLIEAYQMQGAVEAMEDELGEVLLEVLDDED